MKIFVMGSNSFSGATFVKYALSKNAIVKGISRSKELNKVFLPYKFNDKKSSNFTFQKLDINKDLKKIISSIEKFKPNYIINFAAQSMVGESWERPQDWLETNTVSTIKFHNLIKDLDFIKKYVHVSTPEVYGSNPNHIKENQPFSPSTPYAVSRAATDLSLKTFYDAYNFPVVLTRAANVYGPGQQLYRIIPRTILFILLNKKIQLHGGGLSQRSFINMEDVSNATWKIMKNGEIGSTYHISSKEIIKIKDLVKLICTRLDVKYNEFVEITKDRIGKDSSYLLDDSKIRKSLKWRDEISLNKGIDDCINWIKTNLNILKNQPFNYIHKK